MADDVLGKVPEALSKRERVIPLVDGGDVVVRRWNWARESAALQMIVGLLGSIDLKGLGSRGPLESVASLIGLLADKAPSLVKLSVSTEDFARWEDLAPVDRLEILTAIYELNHLEAYGKKLLGAWRVLRPSATANESGSR